MEEVPVSVCIILACSLVAVAAAVRSTWSPCGLSMLATITPFSERAKGHSYRATSAWFVAGATAGGASLGLVLAASAMLVSEIRPSAAAAAAVALVASLVAAASDAGVAGFHLPYHRRQVNERWLDQFRPSVYGIGFGWQIGTGLATYITTAAVYLMMVLGALTGRPLVALAVGTGFGMLRGLAVLLTRNLVDPSGLRAFHRRFSEVGPVVARVVPGVALGVAALIAVWLGSPVGIGAVAVVAVTVVATSIRGARASGGTPTLPTCPVPGGMATRSDQDLAAAGGGGRPA